MKMRILLAIGIMALGMTTLPSCKAKSCDVDNSISDDGHSRKRKKNIGLFSKKELRRKKW